MPRKPDEPVRLTRIYTRGGDAGETSLGDGARVSKLDARIAAYGTVDELSAAIGLALATDCPEAIREVVLPGHEVWVAEVDDRVVGFAALTEDLLGHMYVHPDQQGRGIGTALFEVVKRERPDGFRLWVFQRNNGARRFYERHGCRVVELTDGSGNEEKEPDALYEWRP